MNNFSTTILTDVTSIEVSLAVKDLESVCLWYQTYLGFKVVLKRDFPEYGTRIVFLEVNNVVIELIEDQLWKPVDRPNPPRHTTIQGCSQIRFNVKDIQEVVDRVKRHPEIVIEWDLVVVKDIGFKEFFIRDIEGNILQFAERF